MRINIQGGKDPPQPTDRATRLLGQVVFPQGDSTEAGFEEVVLLGFARDAADPALEMSDDLLCLGGIFQTGGDLGDGAGFLRLLPVDESDCFSR